MTKEELLQPRFQVLLPMPFVGVAIVGRIFTKRNKHSYSYIEDGDKMNWYPDFKLEDYPHLFRNLNWYDYVAEKDLPKYLQFINDEGDIEFVLKVEKYIYHNGSNTHWWAFEYLWQNEPDLKRMSLQGWTPATEEEYLKQNLK